MDNEVSELDDLDLELERLEKIWYFIKEKRRVLANDIDAHRAYIAPIRRIPDDVLREIMMQCLPTEAPPSHITTHTAPVLLTHICSRWRDIALSTPRLWASLCVSFRLNGPKPDENPWNPPTRWTDMKRFSLRDVSTPSADLISVWEDDANAMRHWLSLTGACPLVLSFGYVPRVTHPIPCIDLFFQFLIATAPRWGSIDIVPNGTASELPLFFKSAALTL